MKKAIAVTLALALTLGALAGCAPQNTTSTPPATPGTTASPSQSPEGQKNAGKLAFVTGTGGLGDKNLNDFTYAGAQKHEQEGVTVDVVQPKDIADLPNLQTLYAETGEYATIICIGTDQKDALTQVSPQFPEQNFIICDTQLDLPNVTSLFFRAEETGFQLGVIAGLLVKEGKLENLRGKNTIGFVGGKDIATINRFAAGYQAGAKLVNPEINVLTSYVGSFGDPSAATELATGMYDQGADIIFACAGGSGLGVFSAAEKSKGYAFGIETNQNGLAPDNIIASGTRDWSKAVYEAAQKALDGTLEAGLLSYGISDGALMPERSGSNVPVSDEIIKTMEDLSAKVAAGTYVLPISIDEVADFLANNSL